MGKVIDFVRGNIFWVLMALVVLVLVAVYIFIGRGMAESVASQRNQLTGQIGELEEWSKKPVIPNDAMIKAAKQELQKFDTLLGQETVLYAGRSDFLDEPFAALRDLRPEQIGPAQALRWRYEYEERTKGLVKQAKEQLNAADDALLFEPVAAGAAPALPQMQALQRRFWMTRYMIEALKLASPPETRIIDKLVNLRVGMGPGVLQHPWERTIRCRIQVKMPYENVNKLIAALQNGPRPLMVHEYIAVQPGLAGIVVQAAGAPRPAEPAGGAPVLSQLDPSVDVTLECDVMEFLPVVESVSFSGFKDAAAVTGWLGRENRLLSAAAGVLAERIPGLKARMEFVRREQAALQAGEAGPGAPAEDQFALVYDHLYPLVPQKAFFIGGSARDRRFVAVQVPEGSPAGGQWVIAEYPQDAAGPDDSRFSLSQKKTEVMNKDPRLKDIITVEQKDPVRVVVFIDDKRPPQAVQVLIGEAGQRWRLCPAVKVEGKPLLLSEAAFRFAPAVQAAAERVRTVKLAPDAMKLEITPEAVLQKKREKFEVKVVGPPAGVLTIAVDLRK